LQSETIPVMLVCNDEETVKRSFESDKYTSEQFTINHKIYTASILRR